jgi:hypothetical protein
MTSHQNGRLASKRGRSPVSDAQGPPHSVIGVGGVFFGYLAQRRGQVNEATWKEVAKQLASDDPNV